MIKKLTKNLDAYLVSLILNINVVRFLLGIDGTNAMILMLYVVCIIFLYRSNIKNVCRIYRSSSQVRYNITYWCLMLAYSLVTAALVTQELVMFFKLSVTILIAILCFGLSIQKIRIILLSFLSLNILYGLIILLYPDKVLANDGTSLTYLNLTITLGLCLTLSLVGVVFYYYNSVRKKLIIALGASFFFFFAIFPFPARGVMLFPPLIALLMALLNCKNHFAKFNVIIVALVVAISGAVAYFVSNSSDYALAHMTNLFENTEGESRVVVWEDAINTVVDKLWMFWGGGINAFEKLKGHYPHNIFLHILADFGVFGLLGFIPVVVFTFKRYFKVNRRKTAVDIHEINFMCFASFLYYLLTFSKSFSLYDSCPFLIIISLCMSIPYRSLTFGNSVDITHILPKQDCHNESNPSLL